MSDFAIFAVSFLSTLLIAILWLYPSSKKITTIPGLNPSSKEDGNISDISRAGSLHEFLADLHKQFGPIAGFWYGQTYTVSIASPQLFKQHSNVFDRPPLLFKVFEPLFGPASIQCTNGAEGRARRHHYDHAFAHDRLHAYCEMFQKAANATVKKWSVRTEEDHVPLMEDMFCLSVQAGLLTTLGKFFKDVKLVESFRNAYDNVREVWGEMEHSLFDPIVPDKDSQRIKQFDEALNYLKKTTLKVVEHRKETTVQGTLVIDEIIEFASGDGVVESDSITYLVGSLHTTGNLLTWCLYFLATHKDVQDKLYKEIKSVLGTNGLVDTSNISDLRYMRQVIDETLRCAVIAPWGARYQNFDSELGGHKVPKNTPVIHALGVVLQDETIWPMPKKFDPERFNEENRKAQHPFAFQPFGFAGKRKCPAHRYAYIESSVVLATILQKFEINMHGEQVVLPVYGLVAHPAEEIWVQLIKRT